MNFTKLNAIIIDGDMNSRSRLRQVGRALPDFEELYPVGSFQEAIEKLHGGGTYDVLFISEQYGIDSILEFVRGCRETKVCQDCSFILVFRTRDVTTSSIAEDLAKGADGFLFEPYSTEGLQQTVEVARRVKFHSARKRAKVALGVLVPALVVALEQGKHTDTGAIDGEAKQKFDEVKDTCRFLKHFCETSGNAYPEIVDEITSEIQSLTRKDYSGPSKRIKTKLDSEAQLAKMICQELLKI